MPTTPPTPNDLTRQQLDELDTLLQRMLNLPLSGSSDADTDALPEPPLPDEPEALTPAVNGWREDAATEPRVPYLAGGPGSQPAPQPTPVVELMMAAEPLPGAPAAEPTRWFAPPTPDTGVPPSTLRGVDAPAVPTDFRQLFADVPPEPVSATTVPLTPPPAPALGSASRLTPAPAPDPGPRTPDSGPRVPVLLWPVFAVNWVLEGILGLFGPIGGVVTHPVSKHVLGPTGLLLMAGAGAWAARGMGWIQVDIHLPLPWPR